MVVRYTRTLVAAAGLAVLLGAGVVAPASAAVIVPVAPIAPDRPAHSGPVAQPAPAPAKGPLPRVTAKSIQTKAIKAATGATSFHVKATMKGEGEVLTMDAVVSKAAGKVTMASSVQGTAYLIRVKSAIFLSGDRKFWLSATEDDAESADLLAGVWIKVAGNSQDRKDLLAITTPKAWTDILAAIKTTKRVAGKNVRGKATLGLFEPGALGGVLYVAAKGVSYPLAVESSDKSVAISYFDWNKKVKIAAPRIFIEIPV